MRELVTLPMVFRSGLSAQGRVRLKSLGVPQIVLNFPYRFVPRNVRAVIEHPATNASFPLCCLREED